MARPSKHDGAFSNVTTAKILVDALPGSGRVSRHRESTYTEDWEEAQRRCASGFTPEMTSTLEIVRKGEQLNFQRWVDFFLENYSKPPIRAAKTHEANLRAICIYRKPSGLASSGTSQRTISSCICSAGFRIESV